MSETPRHRATQALREHAPELAGGAVVELGHGLDNTAFQAGGLVVRVAVDGRGVVWEARLLEVVAARVSVPVPVVRFAVEDVLAYPMLPGRPLLGRQAPPGTAGTLGRFLRELHAIDVAELDVPVEPADPAEWLEDLDGPAELLRILRQTVPAPVDAVVLAHADLGAEHILEHDGEVTGVIDWSDAAVTDPALDFARLLRDFGPDFLAQVRDAYGEIPDMARIEFFARCAALEDLAHGGEHARAAERSLRRLFP
ncbi:phosphotransferase [Dactylosporangium sp. NPDC005555]|uniref:phosphotransferase n=1 Tax=Dactylosporangium sp. NPDC005555 TaxID=3154889 RepID=UPI00339F2F35